MERLYHLPLMLTLVNSVNTDTENEKNDMWAFFQTLRTIATGELDEALFQTSKDDLVKEWTDPRLLFGRDGGGILGIDPTDVTHMTVAALRAEVFLSRGKSALRLIRSQDNKELAFQMKKRGCPVCVDSYRRYIQVAQYPAGRL